MGATSLWEKFQSLAPSVDSEAVSAIRCGLMNQHLMVRGAYGEPVLLLATEPRTNPRADIRLRHVSVMFDRSFEVANSESGGVDVGTYCKFTCNSTSSYLHQYFVELMAATASTHMGLLSQDSSDTVVDALLELFRKSSLSSDQSISGLWGELFLIHSAAAPAAFIDAWHLRATDSFDFAFPEARIEVKASERPTREHEFSLRQVRTGRGSDLVASVILSSSSAGHTVLDLARLIAERVDEVRQAKLWSIVFETLGDDAEVSGEQRFDLKGAAESLVFVNSNDIPAPEVSEACSPFVTDVRFRCNISSLCAASSVVKTEVLELTT